MHLKKKQQHFSLIIKTTLNEMKFVVLISKNNFRNNIVYNMLQTNNDKLCLLKI